MSVSSVITPGVLSSEEAEQRIGGTVFAATSQILSCCAFCRDKSDFTVPDLSHLEAKYLYEDNPLIVNAERSYDFIEVCGWFAARCDLVSRLSG